GGLPPLVRTRRRALCAHRAASKRRKVMHRLLRQSLILAALLAAPAPAGAQAAEQARPDVEIAPLPIDPEVTIGRLPNGLMYYIRKNGEPERRIELRLVVKAGSLQEDDDQRGLAHFLEHMA